MDPKQFLMQRPLALACMAVTCGGLANIAAAQDSENNEPHTVDEIIVEGVPLDRTIKELAQPASVLSGDELLKRQAASIGETLAHELGVSSTYFGPVSSRPVIRGQYGERIRVLSNALDAMDASALSEDHAVSVDSLLAERIEIIRGPATLLYGSGAAGGLVNVVDSRIQENGLDAPFGGRVALGTDSATGRQAGAGEIKFGSDAVALHLDFFRRTTDDVKIPGFAESALLHALEGHEDEHEDEHDEEHEDEHEEEEAYGVVENTSSEAQGGAFAVTFIGDNGFLGLSYSGNQNLYGIPGHHHHHEEEEEHEEEEHEEEEHHEESVRVDLDQSRIDLEAAYRFANLGEMRLKLARNDYEHIELEGDEIGTQFNSEGTDARLEFRHQPIGGMEGAFGLQHKDVDFLAIGDEAFVPGSTTQQTSLFAFEEWQPVEGWTLQGSARVENQSIDSSGLEAYDDTAVGASIGVIRALGDRNSIALNYALTQRHPNATELYADGAHVAVQRIERGSVAQGIGIFDKETSSNIDLTFRGNNDRIEWAVTAFLNNIDDYILLSPTTQMEDELQVYEYGQTDARLYGFEAESRVELFDSDKGHLHTRLFTDYVYGEDDRTGGYLPRITPLRYGVGLHYAKNGFEASGEAVFHSEQDKTATGELPTDSYTLLNAEVSYLIENPQLFVFLRGTNLGDEDARQHTSPLKDLVPLPGRSIQLGLRYDF